MNTNITTAAVQTLPVPIVYNTSKTVLKVRKQARRTSVCTKLINVKLALLSSSVDTTN